MHSLRVAAPLLLAILLATPALPAAAAGVSASGPLTGKIVCLDAGHGGDDPGAVSRAYPGLYESDINLDEAYAVKALLEDAGAGVIMTRAGDDTLVERDRAPFCNDRNTTILVSIHTNSFVDPGPNGTMVDYRKTVDQPLARAIHDRLYAALWERPGVTPPAYSDYGVRRFGANVLRRSTMPAALVEPLFLSNLAEAARLSQPIYTASGSGKLTLGCPNMACRRGQVARGIYQGILHYFGAG